MGVEGEIHKRDRRVVEGVDPTVGDERFVRLKDIVDSGGVEPPDERGQTGVALEGVALKQRLGESKKDGHHQLFLAHRDFP